MSDSESITAPRRKVSLSIDERMAKAFYSKVEERPDGCWTWRGKHDRYGYPRWPSKLQRVTAPHRWSYERAYGPIPAGKQTDHLCRVRGCLNPGHMEAVTSLTNTRRGATTKLDAKAAAYIKWISARQAPPTRVQIGEWFGVTAANIRAVVIGITWRDVEPAEPPEPLRSLPRVRYARRQ